MIRFVPVVLANEHFVSEIFAGETEQYWVHYNVYWLENSVRLPDIHCRLIHSDDHDDPVGFIVFGQHFADEELTERVPQTMEIIHMVIHKPFQGRGYGRAATLKAIETLKEMTEHIEIVIAHNPENIPARKLYDSLEFIEYARNYDDDPLMRLSDKEFK